MPEKKGVGGGRAEAVPTAAETRSDRRMRDLDRRFEVQMGRLQDIEKANKEHLRRRIQSLEDSKSVELARPSPPVHPPARPGRAPKKRGR